MANPFAYEEYRKDKIRQKIEESRTQRVQVKVRDLFTSGYSFTQFVEQNCPNLRPEQLYLFVCVREEITTFSLFLAQY